MEKDKYKTLVVFRKFNEDSDFNQLIAIFPNDNYFHYESTTKNSYMHVGQHGACELNCMMTTTSKVELSKCNDLIEELESVGYDLDIVETYTYPKDSSIIL